MIPTQTAENSPTAQTVVLAITGKPLIGDGS